MLLKKVPRGSFTSVCLIKVDLSQQASPYMFTAHFLFMLTLLTGLLLLDFSLPVFWGFFSIPGMRIN